LVSEKKVTHQKRGFPIQVGAMAEDGKFKVEKFNNQNYQLWKMKNGRLSISEGSFPTIGNKIKATIEYEG
jgi:hypothetical protein